MMKQQKGTYKNNDIIKTIKKMICVIGKLKLLKMKMS